MKEIIREFSMSIIVVSACLLCMILLSGIRMSDGTTGIFSIIGKAAQTEDIRAGHGQDASEMNMFGNRAKPVIVCEENIHERQEVNLKSCFKVTDNDGVVLADTGKKILAIKDSSGNDMMLYYDESTGKITFPYKGVYSVTIRICDSKNVITRRNMEVAVDI